MTWHTYLWTGIVVSIMLSFWIAYANIMKKEEKKRNENHRKISLYGAIVFTIASILGIVFSFMEFKNPYIPPPDLNTNPLEEVSLLTDKLLGGQQRREL